MESYIVDDTTGYLLEKFINQASSTPDDVAVSFDEQVLTYRELDNSSNKLAHYLKECGVGTDSFVAVLMSRSVELIIALYGVLKAGGAYIPIDPDYPEARIQHMLEDSMPLIILSQSQWVNCIPLDSAKVVELDTCWYNISKFPNTSLCPTEANDLAYAIYTSGSTGLPKGVMIEHRSIANRLDWMQDVFQLNNSDCVLQKTSISFDVSVWELFWPLRCGAKMVLAKPDGHKDSSYLVNLIQEKSITTLHFVPSMLYVFLQAPGVSQCQSLRRVFCSGEALTFALQQSFFKLLPNVELHNLYGPTEAAVDVTHWKCDPKSELDFVPIGRAISNTSIYVLDNDRQVVKKGQQGELCIGGIQVGRGYLNRPELTESCFPLDPYSNVPQARMYCTGDMVRELKDGNIEYLGRLDHQVKIRGFRIELGEIETQLASHPGVSNAVVLARQVAEQDIRLISYIVPEWNYAIAKEEETDTVEQWEKVFDQTYKMGQEGSNEATFNIAGWNSSYTDSPIPAKEMQEWLDQTIDRILALNPKRVLEIGCGTGMILHGVAPSCEHYIGTDISEVAIRQLEGDVKQRGLNQVELFKLAGDQLDQFAPASFDTIVINSVVQLFPGVDYLYEVIKQAESLLTVGGKFFLGDIRNRDLLHAFHSSVELYKTQSDTPLNTLLHRVAAKISHEEELCLSPQFFTAICNSLPRLSQAELQLKRGNYKNELTCFRYDVVLHADAEESKIPEQVDWSSAALTLNSLREKLTISKGASFLLIKNIPNARTFKAVSDFSEFHRQEFKLAGELQKHHYSDCDVYEPEAFWQLGDETGHLIRLEWSETADCFDAFISPLKAGPKPENTDIASQDWHQYANNPQNGMLLRQLPADLRKSLSLVLPDYMVPANFVFLSEFPLSPNGKLDRKALPEADLQRVQIAEEYVEPTSDKERILCAIWSETLGVEKIGIHDNFFGLGGDSILSLQIVARANEVGVSLTPAQMFKFHTVAELALIAEEKMSSHAQQSLVNGEHTLTAMQRWTVDYSPIDLHHSNQVLFLKVTRHIDEEIARTALKHLVAHHDGLRLSFNVSEDKTVTAYYLQPENYPLLFEYIDLTNTSNDEQEILMEQHATRLHESLSIEGPLWAVALFDTGDEQHILWTLHHLISDGYSGRLLLVDFEKIYNALVEKWVVKLPPKTTSFQYAAKSFEMLAEKSQIRDSLKFWNELDCVNAHPLALFGTMAKENTTQSIVINIGISETIALLQEVTRKSYAGIDVILLSALALALKKSTRGKEFLVETESHGRQPLFDEVDLSRTVGVFSSMYPVHLDVRGTSINELVSSVQQYLSDLPLHGLSYGLLRYCTNESLMLPYSEKKPELLFNYLGQYDQLFSSESRFELLDNKPGIARSPRENRYHLITVDALVSNGTLLLNWKYGSEVFSDCWMQDLVSNYEHSLKLIIKHYLQAEERPLDANDFPLLNLNDNEFSSLLELGDIENILPLSPLQKALMIHSMSEPNSDAYWVQMDAKLLEPIDISLMRESWQSVQNNNGILRSQFIWSDTGQPLQIVHKQLDISFEYCDVSLKETSQKEDELERRRIERRGYSLQSSSLMHVTVIHFGEQQFHLQWNFHHLLLDGWSMMEVIEEVMANYRSLCSNKTVNKKKRVSYSRYIEWISEQNVNSTREFFGKLLNDYHTPIQLPFDAGCVDETLIGDYGKLEFELSIDITQSLQSYARGERITINTVIQGCWALALASLSATDDVVFGVVVPGRVSQINGVDSIVGLLMNTLPMRARVNKSYSLSKWLHIQQDALVTALEFEHADLALAQAESGLAPGQVLVNSVISVQGYLRGHESLKTWAESLGLMDLHFIDWNDLPLSLAVEVGEVVKVLIKYERRLFSEAAAYRIKGVFETLLVEIADNAHQTIGELLTHLDNFENKRLAKLRKSKAVGIRGARKRVLND